MNKNLLIGVGVLAVVGVGAFFLLRKREKSTEAGSLDLESENLGGGTTAQSAATEAAAAQTAAAETEESIDETLAAPSTPKTRKEARQERRGTRKEERQGRRQTRRDCRAEANAQGLKGKAKRDFKRECKAAGGMNADFAGEEADFAFNGYSCFN
jgi:hypothetical protein